MILLMVAAIVTQITFFETAYRPEFVIRRINAVVGDSGWERQTDNCTITVPRNVPVFNKYKVRDIFRVDDSVKVELGINGVYRTEFEGYIVESPSADIPVVIKCQDEMWKLKKLPANISMKETTLPAFMAKLLPDYEVDSLEMDLGNVRFSQTTVSEVLEKLKDDFGLPSYFQDGKLVVGKVYADNSETHRINLDGAIVKNNLKYKRAEDRLIMVKAVSTLSDGTKVKAEYGDEGGEVKQLTFFNITDKDKLTELAKLDYTKFKVDGYEGDIVCFGNVGAKHGDKVILESETYPDREGTYYVDDRKYKMDDSPQFHVTLSIGPKAA